MLAVALVALAADSVTGKWVYEQAGRQGGPARPTTFDLKADGAKLTGTVTQPAFYRGGGGGGGGAAPAPAATEIANGKVDGANVSFEEVTRDFRGNSMTTKYEGTVSGAEMKLKITMPNFQGGDPRSIEATAKKQ